MAEIIGYDKKVFKKYKGVCPHCGAIIIFEEKELSDQYQYNEYAFSKGTCPGCGYTGVSLDKNKDQYNFTEDFYGWPNITNCPKNCKKCQARCLYRKEQFQDEPEETQNITQPIKYEALIEDYHGHISHYRYQANSDQEAIRMANEDGFEYSGNNDRLWRVDGEYVDYSNFTDAERLKKKENYTRIK